jgi:maleylpyruvate isomerase
VDPSLKDRTDQINEATSRLLATADRFTDAEVGRPSLLPGWSRGHVLTHLARGSDALCNLLEWARTGVPTPAYASPEARVAAIEAGSARSAAELAADLRESAARWRAAVEAMPDEAWNRLVSAPGVGEFPASQVVLRRLVEVELHHVDLGAGYRSTDWPTTFNELELTDPMRTQRADRLY